MKFWKIKLSFSSAHRIDNEPIFILLLLLIRSVEFQLNSSGVLSGGSCRTKKMKHKTVHRWMVTWSLSTWFYCHTTAATPFIITKLSIEWLGSELIILCTFWWKENLAGQISVNIDEWKNWNNYHKCLFHSWLRIGIKWTHNP